MKVCAKCSMEMVCWKNGVLVLYGDSHGYPGDIFRCDGCGAEVVVCNNSSIHVKPEDHSKFKQIVKMP